jgi:LmbE family N-acetylglucosaminyl deacetylase
MEAIVQNPGYRRPPATVLAVFAHPDDETFGPGATLARLAAEGHAVHLLSATRGEAGTIGDSAREGRRRLGDLREEELRGACRALGIREPEILGLPDSGLSRLEEVTLLRPLVRSLRTHRPEIMITFHADGLSGHPDHRTMTVRSRTAFHLAGEEGLWPDLGPPHRADRLWTYAIPESKARLVTYRKLFAVPDGSLDAVLDVRAFLDRKRAAVRAHASQKPFIDHMEHMLGGLEEFWAEEAFVLAAGTPIPSARKPVSHLLAERTGPA